MRALGQRSRREAPRAGPVRRRRAEDSGALGQRHDRVGVARAGQCIDVGDAVGVRAAAVGAQRFGHAGRHRVVGEGQRRCSDIAGGVCLTGDDGVRALGQRCRREAPRAAAVRRRRAEDCGAVGQRDDRVGIARTGQRIHVGDVVGVRDAAVSAEYFRHRWIDSVIGEGQ